MKNYFLKFIGGDHLKLTAEEAARLTMAWMEGAKVLVIHGGAYAAHQIASIAPVDKQVERDLCAIAGIELKDAPRIEQFLSPKKLLT